MTPSFEIQTFENSPEKIMAKNAKTFYFASLILDRKRLNDVARLYTLCRLIDDCADELEGEESLRALEKIKTQILCSPSSPVAKVIADLGVDRRHLSELLNGAIFDAKGGTIRNRDELLVYCYRVAGVVGLMMCPLIGVTDQKAHRHAIDLGIAMQLTNICRDILEDATNERSYIPEEQLSDSGISLQQLRKKGDTPEAVKHLVKNLLDKADLYYESAFNGLSYIPLRPRLCIWLAGRLYQGIGRKIRRKGYEVLRGRTFLNTFEKCLSSAVSLLGVLKPFFWRKRSHQSSLHSNLLHLPGVS